MGRVILVYTLPAKSADRRGKLGAICQAGGIADAKAVNSG